jgi:malate synthase
VTERVRHGRIEIEAGLAAFLAAEALPGTGVEPAAFLGGLEAILAGFAPRNAALLAERDAMQARLDAWHRAYPARPIDLSAYRAFLSGIGYLRAEGPGFTVSTANVDPEIATLAGPQLVVPVNNPRYALNAANARWGSLYDALYGTDAIPGAASGRGYDAARGAAVIARAREVLDRIAPLASGSHADSTGYAVAGGALVVSLKAGRAGSAILRASAAMRGMLARPQPCCCAGTGSMPRSASTAPIRSARTTRPVWPTSCWNLPSPPSWIARIRSLRSMRRTRSRCIAPGSG